MKLIQTAALLPVLLVAGCGWFAPAKMACDPNLSQQAYASREAPPQGFAAPDFLTTPCSADQMQKMADRKARTAPADAAPNNVAAGR